jgi:transposase, IS30 family
MASTCRPCAPPSTCAGRSLSAWPEGRSPSGAAPDGRKGGQDEAVRPADAPTTVPRLPSATVGGVNHLPPRRHAKVSIYQFVYSPEGRALELHRHLLRARRLRRPRFARKPRRATIPPSRTIAQRPAEIGQRHTIGHWEADLLIFRRAHGQANLTSLVERKSRLTRLVPNDNRRSGQVIGAIGQALGSLPPMARQSITFDRGSEFLGYDELTRNHGIEAYFCDPHAPWQKGSVENTNGRLRRFLPGELDLSTLTPARLHEIERQMNDTPRKCLGFRTPQEAFAAALG